MKRLYVKPGLRKIKAGKALALSVIKDAKLKGYKKMRLDTVSSMESANSSYKSLGFREIEPYTYNPLEKALYMELDVFFL